MKMYAKLECSLNQVFVKWRFYCITPWSETIGHFCIFGGFSSHFNGSKVTNQELNFLKKCPDTLRPTSQQKWEMIYIKEQSNNKSVPIPDLFEVKCAVLVNI